MEFKELNKNLKEINIVLKELKKEIGNEAIEKIIKSYKRGNVKEYLRLLNKYNKTKQIPKNEFNRFYLYSWGKGMLPDAIKTLKNIYKNKFYKIDKKILARIFGWGFGDGGINKDNPRYYFLCGKKEDLIDIKRYLEKNIKNIKIHIRENKSYAEIIKNDGSIKKFKGNEKTYIFYIRNSAFVRFLYGIGLPNGQKVLKKFNLPIWIKNGSKEVKKEFLDALFESEGEKNNLFYYKNKIGIKAPILGFNKKIEYEENLRSFLREITKLFLEFNIKCSIDNKIRIGCIRKDGNTTCSGRLWINNSAINIINFSKIIKYKFNKEKKLYLNSTIREAKKKLMKFHKQKLKFKKAIKLFNNGENNIQIAKKLNVCPPTIKQWTIKKEHLPRHLNTNLGGLINE